MEILENLKEVGGTKHSLHLFSKSNNIDDFFSLCLLPVDAKWALVACSNRTWGSEKLRIMVYIGILMTDLVGISTIDLDLNIS
jgi:hypothetical protein